MTEQTKVQSLLDRMAISASALCMLHCLATPLLLVAVPILSSTVLADHEFHLYLVLLVLPISLIALSMGCRRHKDRWVVAFGGLGLTALVAIAFFGHDLLGETGEKVGTVIGGVMLAIGHFRNYQLCRHNGCEG